MIRRCRFALLPIVALLVAACATGVWEGVRVRAEGVRFQLRRPGTSAAAVAGDFNGWSVTAHPMARSGDLWVAVIRLPPGEHLFMYVVDGVWVTPPNAMETVSDGFGGSNGKIAVP